MIEQHNNKKNFDPQHEKTVLDNKLTILSMQNEHIPSVIIEVWVDVGSRHESEEINGMAHFVEHLHFKGTKQRSAKQIAEEFDAIGGHINAYTTKEHTVYSAKVLKEFLPFAIEMLSDIIFNSIYNEEDLEKEKNVILQELAQTKDDPEDVAFENFAKNNFKNQALGRAILGTEENIKSFSREQVVNFVQKYYSASRIIISAVGNFEHQNLVNLVKTTLTPYPNSNIANYAQAYYTGGFSYQANNELSQLHLVVGYEGVSISSDKYYALEILSNIMGGSISSRLFQEIREKLGLVYSIGSFNQYYKDIGIFCISASTAPEQANELIMALSKEIKKIVEDISENELKRCLAQVKSAIYMSREIADNWVSLLASNYFYFNRYISKEEIWANYCKVTLEDVKNLAQEIFSVHKLITISLLGKIAELPHYSKMQTLFTV